MAEITEEKRKLMNELFHAVIDFRRCQLKYFDGVSCGALKRLMEEGERLDAVLTRINGGILPYFYESPEVSICATASMLARGESHHD